MKTFVRWMVIVIFSMTCAFLALAQGNPVIKNVQRTVLHGDVVYYQESLEHQEPDIRFCHAPREVRGLPIACELRWA